MHQLLFLIKKYRSFFIFLLLEVICFWLIVSNNIYQGTAFLSSSNSIVGSIIHNTNNVKEYIDLKTINTDLQTENALLKKELQQLRQKIEFSPRTHIPDIVSKQYDYKPAKVVNNSIRMVKNHITINKGINDGLEPGMGVVGKNGIVGIIKSCTNNFSTVISLLHNQIKVSSEIQGKNTFGTTAWLGDNYTKAVLKYIPRHIQIRKGDTIQTSGYNTIFPPGIPIGIVADYILKKETPFLEVEIDLSTDFSSLQYVYVVTNYLKKEKITLEEQE